jgi:Fic family protein
VRKGAKPARRAAAPLQALDGLARAAIAHVWFETIHPFEDGNGRIGRAIVDMAIAQDHRSPPRLYSLSRELLESRRGYYDALNEASTGTGDVTGWVAFFAQQFAAACRRTGRIVDAALAKSRFWTEHSAVELNTRQRKVLQRLLDDGDGGFLGGLNAEKYMKMTQASKATATRDLSALVIAGLLWTTGQGKGVRYHVNVPGWTHGVEPRNV